MHRMLTTSLPEDFEGQTATWLFMWQVNLAVGGALPGKSPGPDTPFPQTLRMDYVRVYKCVPLIAECGAIYVTCFLVYLTLFLAQAAACKNKYCCKL